MILAVRRPNWNFARNNFLVRINHMEDNIFIHDKANIEGEVVLRQNVSVWAFAAIRGDEGKIIIGGHSNVQEGAVIHGAATIGNNVTIAHGAVVHGAKIGDNVLIGINSVVLDGAEIGDWCIIAAGSVVPPGTKIEEGNMVMGIPAKVVRKLEDKDREYISFACRNYLEKRK